MTGETVDRRRFILTTSIAGIASAATAAQIHDGELGGPPQTVAGSVPWAPGAADAPPEAVGNDFRYFIDAERAFVEAAVDRLIPPSSVGPSATQANVPIFIDRQLLGPFGRGDHFYLGGPWKKGMVEQGYQLRFT